MKAKLIKLLEKEVLLIESEKDLLVEDIRSLEAMYSKKFLRYLKDLADSDCEGLVESWESVAKDGTMVYENYKDSIPKKRNAKESFLSALEAESIKISNSDSINPEIRGSMVRMFAKMKEAEQNVFTPETLVFVEQ